MLVLTRKPEESVVIGDGLCVVTVTEIRGDKVRIGFEAPSHIPIHRKEVWLRLADPDPATAETGARAA